MDVKPEITTPEGLALEKARTHAQDKKIQKQLAQLDILADLMDSKFRLPGTPIRLGVDTLIGLIPGIGDTIGLGVSAYIITHAARLGAKKSIIQRMVFNVGLDWLVGLVPLLGDLFDMGWKANNRNIKLLMDYLETTKPGDRSGF